LLENHEIRALVDNRNETIGKKIRDAEMQKTVYADCEAKKGLFLSVVMDKKEKEYHRYNRRFAANCRRRDQQNIKSIYSLT
jgi:threonyl-tRNA synthetase